jgi:hypothetical protein
MRYYFYVVLYVVYWDYFCAKVGLAFAMVGLRSAQEMIYDEMIYLFAPSTRYCLKPKIVQGAVVSAKLHVKNCEV